MSRIMVTKKANVHYYERPAYGKSLKADDIKGLVAYIRILKKWSLAVTGIQIVKNSFKARGAAAR
jgi:hypothetical protein